MREYGVNVLGLLAIFTYDFQKAADAFNTAACAYQTLTGFKELITMIESNENYSKDEIEFMKNWYQKGL